MFFEDVNTLYEKYKYCSFWYELSYDDIYENWDDENMVDFIETKNNGNLIPHNSFVVNCAYKDESSKPTKYPDAPPISLQYGVPTIHPGESLFIYMYCDYLYENPGTSSPTRSIPVVPISSMNIIKCGTESNTVKVYLKQIKQYMLPTLNVGTGKYVNGDEWDVDLQSTPVLSDDNGYYVELTTRRDGDEFTVVGYEGIGIDPVYFCGKILNYKALPTITFNTLYRGNTQTIEVYFDGELIDSKYYDLLYQNQVLTDNKITIGEDVTDLELEIYLKHPEYISTKLKYNLTVDYYEFNSQAGLEQALELGLTNIKANNPRLSDIELNNITFGGDSSLRLSNCKLNNVTFDGGFVFLNDSENRFVGCELKRVSLHGNDNKLYLTNSTIKECQRVRQVFFVCNENCIITNNSIFNSLIFSDDMITITDNRFDECTPEFGEYYPSTLYLTGEFKCVNNRFNQFVEGNDFFFGVALIKTIKDTNIDEFIRLNDIGTTITIGGDDYSGALFYSLIDDSKLHYKEIE